MTFPETIHILMELNHSEGHTKNRLVKFEKMDKNMFNLHLKECEFRFNNIDEDMYQILLKIFRNKSTLKPS